MKRGHALKTLVLALGLVVISISAWWAWNRADPVVEFERAPLVFPPSGMGKFVPKGPPGPWKGKVPGMVPPKKQPPPDSQQSPQAETRPRVTAPLRLYFRP